MAPKSRAERLEELRRRNPTVLLYDSQVERKHLRDASVDEQKLTDGAVTDNKVRDVSMGKVASGDMLGVYTMLGAIVAGRLRWDGANGLTLTDADGAAIFSVREGAEPFLRGQLEALGLLVENDFELRGANNLIAADAKVVLGGATTGTGAVGNPAAAPGLEMTWEERALPAPGARESLFYDATNTSFWSASKISSGEWKVYENNDDASLTAIRSFTLNNAFLIYGVARVGTRVYVLQLDFGGRIQLKTYSESNLSFLGSTNVENAAGILARSPCLGDDGTNLMVVDLHSSGALRFSKFTRADAPAFVSSTLSSGAGNPTFDINNGWPTGFVAAEGKWWVGWRRGRTDGANNLVAGFSAAGVYSADSHFPGANGTAPRGIAHDGSVFWTLSGASLTKHTNWAPTDANLKHWVGYTYVDDNGAASVNARPLGAGDFETKKSPTGSITLVRRASLKATAAKVNTVLTGITHVGWYMEDGATEPALDYVADSAVTNGVATQKTFTGFTGGGAAPPGTNTFPASAAGDFAEFVSSDGTAIVRGNGLPGFKLRYLAGGTLTTAVDTYIRFGSEDRDTDDFHQAAADGLAASPLSDFDITLAAGHYLITFRANFAGGTGQRHWFWDINGAGGERHTETAVAAATAHRSEFVFNVDAAAGDTLRVGVQQSSGAGLVLTSAGITGIRIGPS